MVCLNSINIFKLSNRGVENYPILARKVRQLGTARDDGRAMWDPASAIEGYIIRQLDGMILDASREASFIFTTPARGGTRQAWEMGHGGSTVS